MLDRIKNTLKTTALYDFFLKMKNANGPVGLADRGVATPPALLNEFGYLLEKIRLAPFALDPFKHIEVKDFLSPEHFTKIVGDDQIHFKPSKDVYELIQKLKERDYKVKKFAGCTADIAEYLKSLEDGETRGSSLETTEGRGVTFRIARYRSRLILDLVTFLNGQEFRDALLKKFEIQADAQTRILTEIQKNLTNYEISPHPDVRQKCMTYLININPTREVSELDVHTHLLRFKSEFKHVYEYWKENTHINRCWVPWNWCETVKRISSNNTIVAFTPGNDTLHAVRLRYDHTVFQRTQIYGNLWYKNVGHLKPSSYKEILSAAKKAA